MVRYLKVLLGVAETSLLVVVAGAALFRIDYEVHKTDCASLSDKEVLAILQPAFDHQKSRSRPEDFGHIRFVPVVHRESQYKSSDPDSSVYVDLVDRKSGRKEYRMLLFGDCGIETWGA